jgi:protein tyrosine phosphatase (PTP) superfamily phosphohydrolase (DUF442 family)
MIVNPRYPSMVFSAAVVGMVMLFQAALAGDDLIVPADSSISIDTRTATPPFMQHLNDMSIPLPTTFSWTVSGIDANPRYDLYLSEDTALDSRALYNADATTPTLPVWNLKIGTRYYWRIAVKSAGQEIRTTARFTFRTPMLWPRMIWVDGATNVRDIGGRVNGAGVTIRQGLCYRTSEFNQNHVITPLGLSQIKALGIVCEIDLRFDDENPQAALGPTVRYFRPRSDVGGLVAYQYGLQNYGPQYRDVFRQMAKAANYPLVFHCRAGADRAGTVAALLEALLGCSEKQMAEDYQWTSLSVYGPRDSASSMWRGVITEIRAYAGEGGELRAGVRNYLVYNGLTVAELDSIEDILLARSVPPDPDPEPEPEPEPEPDPPDTLQPPRISATFIHSRWCMLGQAPLNLNRTVREIAIYSSTGRKLWEYLPGSATHIAKIKPPAALRGVGVVRWVEERMR